MKQAGKQDVVKEKGDVSRRSFLKGALAATPVLLVGTSSKARARTPALSIGPSTIAEPYLLPNIAGAKTPSILTTGDPAGGHRIVGIPDGVGPVRRGRFAFENAVTCPHAQEKTIVALTDDSALSTAGGPNDFPSEVYFYIGTKTRDGHPIEQAGLTNGSLYGLAVGVDGRPVTEESDLFGLGNATTGYIGTGRFDLHNLQDVSNLSARQLEDASIAADVTRVQRCEDGAWDPREGHRNNFYFVTTASTTSNCRLWHLRFDDIERPEIGGTVEILLRADEGHRMLDNVTIDQLGRIVMDEDPGNNSRISKIWLYAIDTREFIQVAAHNPRFFDPDSKKPEFITVDEESSGIIDAAHILGERWFLLDVQAHKPSVDPELVEGGQLLALFVDPDVGLTGTKDKGNRHDDNDELLS